MKQSESRLAGRGFRGLLSPGILLTIRAIDLIDPDAQRTRFPAGESCAGPVSMWWLINYP